MVASELSFLIMFGHIFLVVYRHFVFALKWSKGREVREQFLCVSMNVILQGFGRNWVANT